MGRSYKRRIGDELGAGPRQVLIGIDDPAVAGNLAKLFDEGGLLPTLAFSCDRLIREAGQDVYGLIVLDERFACNHASGCLEKLRVASVAPIMAIGSVHEDTNIDHAVDDPVRDGPELVRRGKLLLDMSRPVRLPHPLRWGPLELDLGRHQARWQGRELRLTAQQFRIMEVLVLAAGRVVSVEQLASRVWGESSQGDREALVAHVRRIRQRLEETPSSPRFLLRVPHGFRLADASDEAGGQAEQSQGASEG